MKALLNIARVKSLSAMTVALWFSLAFHIVVLAIKFEPEIKKFKDRLPSLEVVLVNAKTKNAPDKADLIAQANLDRGGNTEQNRQMKTMMPKPQQKSAEVKLKASVEARASAKASQLQAKQAREQKRVAELEKQAKELMTQINSSYKIESQPNQEATAANPEKGAQKTDVQALNKADLIAASIEIDKLEAQIAKQLEEYQKRPKKRYLGGRTKEAVDAMYLESWRQKVERIGNLNYPSAAREQKIYGSLRMTVEIKSDGSVESIEINKSSGSKILDEAAKNIVKMAAPYAPFSEEMKKNTDILGITRTWTFTQEDYLATESANQ